MYDKNHKLISFVPVKYQNDSKVKKPSSGEYESGILCQECDNSILGSYETYGHNVIYGGTFKQGKKPICHNTVEADLTILNCRNIDYSKLKLFYLSLLWRASISSRPMFKAVDLGTKYTDRIRQMLHTQDPGKDTEFVIVAFTWVKDKSASKDMLLSPRLFKIGYKYMYVLPISGFFYFIYITPDSCHEKLFDYRLKEDGSMRTIGFPKGLFWDFIFKYTGVKR